MTDLTPEHLAEIQSEANSAASTQAEYVVVSISEPLLVSLPPGTYRVVDGVICRIVEDIPPELRREDAIRNLRDEIERLRAKLEEVRLRDSNATAIMRDMNENAARLMAELEIQNVRIANTEQYGRDEERAEIVAMLEALIARHQVDLVEAKGANEQSDYASALDHKAEALSIRRRILRGEHRKGAT